MALTPFPYQLIGRDFLASHRRALLADEMGLGKSVQAILACDAVKAKRVLVVCPAVARINWEREFRTWSKVARCYLPVETEAYLPKTRHSPIYSYDMLMRHHVDKWLDINFDVCILDEAHFLKSPHAVRTREILARGGAATRSKYIWALTGTPMPNNVGELWPLLMAFGQTTLRYNSFIEKYCNTIPSFRGDERRVVDTKKGMAPAIKALLAPIALRRTKAEVLPDLPPLLVGPLVVKRGKVKWSSALMDEMKTQLARVEMELDGVTDPQELFSILEGLAQSVTTLRRYLGLQKVEPAVDLTRELLEANNKEKVGLYCVHQEVAKQIVEGLHKFGPVVITGQTSPSRRQLAVDQFQKDPNCRVFVGNIQAAGTAITLTAGRRVFMVEQEWVPGLNEQAWNRFSRIGQTHPVTVDVLEVDDSLDQKINAGLRRKIRDIKAVFG